MNFTLKAFVTGTALIALISSASAGTVKITTNSYSNGSSGGSYTLKFITGDEDNSSYSDESKLSDGTFEGFCLEPGEYFTSGKTYDYTVSNIVYGGGKNEHGTGLDGKGDALSVGTAWLYSLFAQGTLPGFDYDYGYSSDRKDDNKSLQKAFWDLEDESYSMNNFYKGLLLTEFGSLAAARADADVGQYGVWALNLTSTTYSWHRGKMKEATVYHQSQLFYSGVPTTSVPDNGTTLALIGAAVLGLGLVRRKISAK